MQDQLKSEAKDIEQYVKSVTKHDVKAIHRIAVSYPWCSECRCRMPRGHPEHIKTR